jgi:hypothetical protein
VASLVDKKACVEIFGVASAQAAALQYHGKLELRQASPQANCPYLVVDVNAQASLSSAVNLPDWAFQATVRKPTDKTENMLVFKRVSINTPSSPAAAPRHP